MDNLQNLGVESERVVGSGVPVVNYNYACVKVLKTVMSGGPSGGIYHKTFSQLMKDMSLVKQGEYYCVACGGVYDVGEFAYHLFFVIQDLLKCHAVMLFKCELHGFVDYTCIDSCYRQLSVLRLSCVVLPQFDQVQKYQLAKGKIELLRRGISNAVGAHVGLHHGSELSHRRASTGHDYNCHTFTHPLYGELCVQTGHSHVEIDRMQAHVNGSLFRVNGSGACQNCGAQKISVDGF